jgi:hypothetical protein
MASIEMTNPLHVVPARFLLLLARSFSTIICALGVIQGDEGIDRRYEADNSYDMLGTRGKNSTHRTCQWVQIAHLVTGDGHWQGRLPGR